MNQMFVDVPGSPEFSAECGVKRAIGLEHRTLLELAPPEFSLAAAAGFDTVRLRCL